MTDLCNRFRRIINNNGFNEMIEFLKPLTAEEKKSLVPELIKFEEADNTFVNLRGNVYGVRGSRERLRVLKIAATTLLSRKDYEKYYFGIDAEILGELEQQHMPGWLNSYIKIHGITSITGLRYPTLMSWIENGRIAPCTPEAYATLLAREIRNAEVLSERKITLEEHFWFLFDYDFGQNFSDTTVLDNGFHKCDPYSAIITLVNSGKLDRRRILRESLVATGKGFKKDLTGWFAGLFEAINPDENEIIEFQQLLFNVFSCPHSRPVNIALSLIKKIATHPQFDATEFLEQSGVLMSSGIKSIQQKTLAVIEKTAAAGNSNEYETAVALSSAFLSNDDAIQSKAAKLLVKYCSECGRQLAILLEPYTAVMLSTAKTTLGSILGNNVPLSDDDTGFIPEVSLLTAPENILTEIKTFDDFLFLASKVIENGSPADISLFLEASRRMAVEYRPFDFERFSTILLQAIKTVSKWTDSYVTYIMAAFMIDYTKALIRVYPKESDKIRKMLDSVIAADELRKNDSGYVYLRLKDVGINNRKRMDNHNVSIPEGNMYALRQLMTRILNQVESMGNKTGLLEKVKGFLNKNRMNISPELPLLSTATHHPAFIDPEILAGRLEIYIAAGAEPDDIDMQIALSRTMFSEATAETRSRIKQWPDCESRNLMMFMLGNDNCVPQPPFTHNSWWMTAGLIKSPVKVYSEFRDFPYLKGNIEYLSGNFTWHNYNEHHKQRSSYSDTEICWTNHWLRLEIPSGKNVSSNREYFYKYTYRSLDSNHPLLVETLFPTIQRFNFNAGRDLKFMLWLTPCAPESLLASCIGCAMSESGKPEAHDTMITLAASETFLDLPHRWNNISYLFQAAAMLSADKTVRDYAAATWSKRVLEGTVDNIRLGKTIGTLEAAPWAPLKRLTDLITSGMSGITPLHSMELETMLSEIIAAQPHQPVTGIKKLLEIYRETIISNGNIPLKENVRERLTLWQSTANLKQISTSLLKRLI